MTKIEGETIVPEPAAITDEIGILARRRIEAGVIAPIYEEMVREIGETRAQAILDSAISKAAIAQAHEFAKRAEGGTNLKTFQALQSLWTKDDALEVEVLTATEQRFDFNVRRCRYAETYRDMGLGRIGHLLSCNRDGAFCEGYNPSIKLTRTQTLMKGADYCDFRYTFEADASATDPMKDETLR